MATDLYGSNACGWARPIGNAATAAETVYVRPILHTLRDGLGNASALNVTELRRSKSWSRRNAR